ncbi:hypothetical protein LNP74_29880 [Klebsiella pneumoniae subsp. pneumoniae]|nr:hypothetical protein [Klebsiella pneumoniae subsp. pneumoniae]
MGSFRGAFRPLSAVDLGAAVAACLNAASCPPRSGSTNANFRPVLTAGCGQNPARQTALRANGLPVDTPAVTVNLVCGSGLAKRVQQSAVQAIRWAATPGSLSPAAGEHEQCSYLMHGARDGLRFGHASLQGQHDPGRPVGRLQRLPRGHYRRGPRRRLRHQPPSARTPSPPASQRKAAAAIAAGRFREEIAWSASRSAQKAAATRD